ncbi:MAG: glucose 1-dehydrogenase [Proteobacteria bacterium]|nr:glucose 1-dehydrogenase [Pseudomonadota bacterium]MBU1386765.1 glucose 1-dehydrogenase [Pseudomonadota bacterium]MBU1544709.1 glucose 1-dehydrogenase [Pseudomonadota bacterium]MBU2429201.1 glucose 1-dehydrogenase [Pseudomonadota bacterium]MBU2481872.1 glucose 1-dehydrogenase [Pseudomonadota bacterium]
MGDRLKGKAAIITGGTSGIGRKTVEVFAAEGASVLIAARREKEGRQLADDLGHNVHFIRTDVSCEEDIKQMITHAVELFGKLDCLFNNAGCPAPVGSIETIPLKGYENAMSVLLGGVLLGMKHATPVMHRQGFGSIINNGSVAGILAGYSSSIIYSAAKAAVIHLTKVVAMELGETNIRVNCISPGGIATGIFAKAMGSSIESAEKSVEIVKTGLAGMQPIPRAGMPEDIASAAVFLASDESSFINGHNLVVDGGVIGGRLWSVQQNALDRMREALGLSQN